MTVGVLFIIVIIVIWLAFSIHSLIKTAKDKPSMLTITNAFLITLGVIYLLTRVAKVIIEWLAVNWNNNII